MKKISTLLIALFFAAGVFAADATVTYVSGKVEVQRGDKWVPLQKGDTLSKSDMVSTGFQSEAKIKIYDSVMYLGPVTRVTLEELSTNGKTDNVSVYLKTGAARSQVKHVDDKRVKYQVHTAVAVASCRGTDWIIDDSNQVIGIDGTIAVKEWIEPLAVVDNKEGEGEGEGDKKEKGDKNEDKEEKSDDKKDNKKEDKKQDKQEAKQEAEDVSTDDALADADLDNDLDDADDDFYDDDGATFIGANQSLTVTEKGTVNAPVNTVEDNAQKVIAAVSTESQKTSVATVAEVKTETVKSPEPEAPAPAPVETVPVVKDPVTGTVIVTISF